ncbi:MAG: MFS transporter [bacterium]
MRWIIFLYASIRFLQGLLYFFLALILNERGFSGIEIGILLSLYTLTPILLSLPSGVLNDRIPSRFLLGLSLLGSALFYFCFAEASPFPVLLLLFLLGGASANLANISVQSLALKVVGERHRSFRLGFYSGGGNFGMALGIMAGGLILKYASTGYLLHFAALAHLALAVSSLYLRDAATIRIHLPDYLSVLREKGVLSFCLVYAVFAFHWGAETSSYSLFLRDFFHLSKEISAFYMGIPIFCLGAASILTGRRLDKNTALIDRMTILAFTLSGLGQILMVLHPLSLSLFMRILHETGDGIAATLLLIGMAARFDVERIGGLSSLVTLFNILSQSLGALVFSQVGEHFGYQVSMVAGGFSALLPIFLYLAAKPQRDARSYPGHFS